jgi:hypothetical protein
MQKPPPEKNWGATDKSRGAAEKITNALATYNTTDEAATLFAVRLVARRHRLDLHLASVVCELAAIGGRAA